MAEYIIQEAVREIETELGDAKGVITEREVIGELIRCKDCKYVSTWRSKESARKFGQIYECLRDNLYNPHPRDFCSRAERREDE